MGPMLGMGGSEMMPQMVGLAGHNMGAQKHPVSLLNEKRGYASVVHFL